MRIVLALFLFSVLAFGQASSIPGGVPTGIPAANSTFTQTGTGAIPQTQDVFDKERVSVTQFGADRTGALDSTGSINNCLNSVANIGGCFVPPGTYKVSNITIPASTTLWGLGTRVTTFKGKAGSTGVMVTDQGNGAGIQIWGITLDGNHESYSAGLKLGYNAFQFGTEGYLHDIYSRNFDSGSCIDLNANVVYGSELYADTCVEGIKLSGNSNNLSHVSAVATSSIGIHVMASLNVLNGVEVEAPATGSTPIQIDQTPVQIHDPLISLANNTTFSDLIVISDPGAENKPIVDGIVVALAGTASYSHALKVGATSYITPSEYNSGHNSFFKLFGDVGGYPGATTVSSIAGKAVSLANSLTTSGNFALTLTTTASTNVALPTSGTLVGSADTGTVTNTMLAGSIAASKITSTAVVGGGNLTTVGGIPYVSASGVLQQDSSNLFWDSANKRLGIGTASPAANAFFSGGLAVLHIKDPNNLPNIRLQTTTGSGDFTIGADASNVYFYSAGASTFRFFTNAVERMQLTPSTGNLLVGGTTDGNYRLDLQKSGSAGTARFFDQTATTGATRVLVSLGAADSATTVTVTNAGTTKSAGYQSSDGTAGGTFTFTDGAARTCTVKNGITTGCV